MYVVVLPAPGVPEGRRRQIEDALARGVRGDGTTAVLTPERPTGAPAPDVRLAEGDAALRAARDQVADLDLDAAIASLERAIAAYRDNLPDLALRDGGPHRLVAAYRQLAIARFLNGDDPGAKAALAHVFALAPETEYDPKVFPPQMADVVLEAGLLAAELGPGQLRVRVSGGDATIYVDGEERGRAPVVVDDLAAGPHVVSAVAAGVPTATAEVTVDAATPADVVLSVPQPPVAVPDAVLAVRDGVGRSTAPAAMRALRSRLGVDAVVFATLQPDGRRTRVTAHVYDLRSGALAGRAAGTNPVDVGAAVVRVAQWSPRPEREGPAPWAVWDPDHEYFWYAVRAAAGVATVTTVAVILSRSRGLDSGRRIVVLGVTRPL